MLIFGLVNFILILTYYQIHPYFNLYYHEISWLTHLFGFAQSVALIFPISIISLCKYKKIKMLLSLTYLGLLFPIFFINTVSLRFTRLNISTDMWRLVSEYQSIRDLNVNISMILLVFGMTGIFSVLEFFVFKFTYSQKQLNPIIKPLVNIVLFFCLIAFVIYKPTGNFLLFATHSSKSIMLFLPRVFQPELMKNPVVIKEGYSKNVLSNNQTLQCLALSQRIKQKHEENLRFIDRLPSATASGPNILFIGIESLRAKEFTAQYLPKTFNQLTRGSLWDNNYSTGNRTPVGLYGLLTGETGLKWFVSFMYGLKPLRSVILDKIGYVSRFFMSSSLDYLSMSDYMIGPTDHVYEPAWGKPYERDIRTVDLYLNNLESDKDSKPRFDFVWFDATHYPFDYEGSETLDYELPDILQRDEALIEKYKERHERSLAFVDQQISRILDQLKSTNTLEKTIIVISGDHGTNLFENGILGHSTSFNDPQTKVPVLWHVPTNLPRMKVAGISSHADIIPTILGIISAPRELISLFQGHDLNQTNDSAVFISQVFESSTLCMTLHMAKTSTESAEFFLKFSERFEIEATNGEVFDPSWKARIETKINELF